MDPSSDVALVALLRAGDPVAFERVYARLGPRIFNFLARMTGSRQLAEDLQQETWIKLAIHAPRLAEDTDLAAWLYTVARNFARSERRSARALPVTTSVAHDSVSAAASPYEWAAASETEARLERALAELPGPFREVVLLVVIEGLEPERAARVLGLTHDAVRQRLSRARAKLAARLEELATLPPSAGKESAHAARRPSH